MLISFLQWWAYHDGKGTFVTQDYRITYAGKGTGLFRVRYRSPLWARLGEFVIGDALMPSKEYVRPFGFDHPDKFLGRIER